MTMMTMKQQQQQQQQFPNYWYPPLRIVELGAGVGASRHFSYLVMKVFSL
jgi:hypothetical protein